MNLNQQQKILIKKGYSEHYVTPGDEKQEVYDYRDFDLKANNEKLEGLVLEIKNGYEIIDKFQIGE